MDVDEVAEGEAGSEGTSDGGTAAATAESEMVEEVVVVLGFEGWMEGDDWRLDRCICRCVVMRLFRWV